MCIRGFLTACLPFPVATECRPTIDLKKGRKQVFWTLQKPQLQIITRNSCCQPKRRIEVPSDSRRVLLCRGGWIIPAKQQILTSQDMFGTQYQILLFCFISVIYGGLFHYSDLLTVSRLELLMQQLIHSLPCLFDCLYTFPSSLYTAIIISNESLHWHL